MKSTSLLIFAVALLAAIGVQAQPSNGNGKGNGNGATGNSGNGNSAGANNGAGNSGAGNSGASSNGSAGGNGGAGTLRQGASKFELPRIKASRSTEHDCELRFNQTVINHDGSVALCCSVYDKPNMLGLDFLSTPHAELERAKYRHSFCGTCMSHGLHYSVQDPARVTGPPGR